MNLDHKGLESPTIQSNALQPITPIVKGKSLHRESNLGISNSLNNGIKIISDKHNILELIYYGCQKRTTIRIITQRALGSSGLVYTYGVIINGHHRCVLHSTDELNAFLKGLGVDYG